jgi:PEGA domain
MTGAIVATSIVFFPAAPFFLFMHGKDITIPKGTEITAYINGDASLDPAKFAPKVVTPEPAAEGVATPAVAEPSTIVIKSTPDGADITVDGKFVGSTPSTLKLTIGEHTITIEKSGFKLWTRTMTVSSAGNVSIDATLEQIP